MAGRACAFVRGGVARGGPSAAPSAQLAVRWLGEPRAARVFLQVTDGARVRGVVRHGCSGTSRTRRTGCGRWD